MRSYSIFYVFQSLRSIYQQNKTEPERHFLRPVEEMGCLLGSQTCRCPCCRIPPPCIWGAPSWQGPPQRTQLQKACCEHQPTHWCILHLFVSKRLKFFLPSEMIWTSNIELHHGHFSGSSLCNHSNDSIFTANGLSAMMTTTEILTRVVTRMMGRAGSLRYTAPLSSARPKICVISLFLDENRCLNNS